MCSCLDAAQQSQLARVLSSAQSRLSLLCEPPGPKEILTTVEWYCQRDAVNHCTFTNGAEKPKRCFLSHKRENDTAVPHGTASRSQRTIHPQTPTWERGVLLHETAHIQHKRSGPQPGPQSLEAPSAYPSEIDRHMASTLSPLVCDSFDSNSDNASS